MSVGMLQRRHALAELDHQPGTGVTGRLHQIAHLYLYGYHRFLPRFTASA
jgi:hypothetical protein